MNKERLIYKKDKLKYLFYPHTSLLLTFIVGVLITLIMYVVLKQYEKGAVGYDISFALLTGVIASIPIALALEMANNLKNNTLAWYELYDYHKVLMNYKYLNKDENSNNLFIYLNKLMPIFKSTLENKKAFLSSIEIDYLQEIINDYEAIKVLVVDYLKNNIKNTNKEKGLNKILKETSYNKEINDIADNLLSDKEGLIYLLDLNNEEIRVHTIAFASNIELLVKEASTKPVFDIMFRRLNNKDN